MNNPPSSYRIDLIDDSTVPLPISQGYYNRHTRQDASGMCS